MQPFAVASTQDATKHSPGMFFPNQRFGASVSCTSCNSLSGCNRRNVIKLHCLGNKKLEDCFGGPLFAAIRSGKHPRCYKTKTPTRFVLFYSISIYFVVSISFFGCSFGIVNLRIPCLNSPLMSASFMSPT
ncbi:unknown [Firmicutes bacterium CAG:341]|nr:unknown [Firmicutes bacterium CAG:341]